MAARDTSKPVPFASAARGVFDLALEGMVWSGRTVVMAGLLALPVVLAIVYRLVLAKYPAARLSPLDLYGRLVVFFYLRFALPLTALFYATALIADEVEGKTLTYLLTRPIRRESILAGKFAAYVVTTLTLALPAVVVTFFTLMTVSGRANLGGAVPDLLRDLGVAALALLAYGALFTLLGVFLKRPVIPGLLFIFVWELFLPSFPGYVPRVTLTAYLRSLVRHRPAQEGVSEIFAQVLPTALCLEVLVGAVVVGLGASAWIFSTREYVMDQ